MLSAISSCFYNGYVKQLSNQIYNKQGDQYVSKMHAYHGYIKANLKTQLKNILKKIFLQLWLFLKTNLDFFSFLQRLQPAYTCVF